MAPATHAAEPPKPSPASEASCQARHAKGYAQKDGLSLGSIDVGVCFGVRCS